MVPDYADMELRQEARATARLLLEAGCVRYDPELPFRLAQGFESPLHVDARLVLSRPAARDELLRLALEMIKRDIGTEGLDAIACRTEGQGVPFATLIADRLCLPLVFVRRSCEDNPHKNSVEGHVEPGWRIMLVEQLVADGARKEALIRPLQDAGATVPELFTLFQYGVFDTIHERLSAMGVRLHALVTWWDLLEAAGETGRLPPEAQEEIRRFLDQPGRWTAQRTG
ncbi:orotate phosphoribosyltransferase [Indioceanicola profundi]|uniref:orotate phosphoribosyltransferase n=1 Tax=Indioceanicola profundi TaxID=2220096 RepID=UPI000E6ABC6F|nr:orotate phosphoribosyltransferase [Indioceanicola profundi]